MARGRYWLVISIHALRKESDGLPNVEGELVDISIHALRKESDRQLANPVERFTISIHALRKESDWTDYINSTTINDFNPRSP